MKKQYIIPQTDITAVTFEGIICSSVTVSTKAQWGAEGTYAPGVWVNEGQSGSVVGGFPAVSASSEEDDWASRSNSGLWE